MKFISSVNTLYNTDVYKIKSRSILNSTSIIEALEYVLQINHQLNSTELCTSTKWLLKIM